MQFDLLHIDDCVDAFVLAIKRLTIRRNSYSHLADAPRSSLEIFNRICTYAIQSAERLPSDATMMLIAGAIDFVIFVERRNEFATGGELRRLVTSVREVNGVDGRVLSSEIFAEGTDGVAVPAAPIQCIDELLAVGYQPHHQTVSA